MPAPTSAARRLARALAVLLLLIGARALMATQDPVLVRQLGPAAAGMLDRALMAGVWLAAAFLLTRALDVCVWQRRVPHLPRLLTDLVGALVWLTAGLTIAGSVLEMPLAGILTTSGVAVAVLGFALRDILASLFAGLALNLEGPFRIGDWLETAPDTVGQVIEIGWLTTRLTTQDGVGLVVPNAQLARGGFKNFNQQPTPWRDQATIVLGYEVSPAHAERVLRAALAQAVGGATRCPDPRLRRAWHGLAAPLPDHELRRPSPGAASGAGGRPAAPVQGRDRAGTAAARPVPRAHAAARLGPPHPA